MVLGSKGSMENSPWNHRSNGKWSLDPKIIFPYWVLSRSSTIACFVSKFFTSIAVCWGVNITISIFLKGSDRNIKEKDLGAAVEEEQNGWTSDGPSLKHNPPHKNMPNLVGKEKIENSIVPVRSETLFTVGIGILVLDCRVIKLNLQC